MAETETAAAEKAAKAPKANQVKDYDLSKSVDTLALATDLAKFIRENKLTHNVQGKEYVNVEGWQYAGMRLGLVPIVEQVTDMSVDAEIKYSARVTLFDLRSQQTVGAGFAVCSNKENGKKFYAEYAIASMAQTRAIGKAFRNILAYLIRAAGYEPTPAEEMDYVIPATLEPLKAEGGNGTPARAEMRVLGSGTQAPAEQPAAGTFDPAKHLPGAPDEGSETPDNDGTEYITGAQKEEIVRLLNNPVISRKRKDATLLAYNAYSKVRAQECIDALRQTIEQLEGERRVAG